MIFLIVACVGSGAVVSWLGTSLMRRLAPAWGLIDRPNARKVHVTPTPLGGGIGVWLGVLLPLLTAHLLALCLKATGVPGWIPAELAKHLDGIAYRSSELWLILGCATAIMLLGIVDDFRNLSWPPKLLVQMAVAIALIAGGVRVTLFVDAPWVGWATAFLWIVVLTNAFNFLDNMDGLSGGIGLIASTFFAIIMLTGTSHPRWFVAGVLLILAGSLAGFLVHNRPPAKIFMGDAGSCLVGMLIASMTIVGTFYDYGGEQGRHVILAPLCVLAVPLYDFTSVVLIRLWQGRSPFHADKQHFSHRLVELGMNRVQAVLTIHLLTITTGLGALLLYQVKGWTGAWLVMGLVISLLAVIAILETAGRSPADGK